MQQVDIMATIASVVTQDDLPATQGQPWGTGRDFALSEVYAAPEQSPRLSHGYCAVYSQGWKYLRRDDGAEELFVLEHDPDEARNVAGSSPEILKWARSIAAESETLRVQRKPTNRSHLEQDVERMRNLGYIR
jgi:hypothetical protein